MLTIAKQHIARFWNVEEGVCWRHLGRVTRVKPHNTEGLQALPTGHHGSAKPCMFCDESSLPVLAVGPGTTFWEGIISHLIQLTDASSADWIVNQLKKCEPNFLSKFDLCFFPFMPRDSIPYATHSAHLYLLTVHVVWPLSEHFWRDGHTLDQNGSFETV